MRFVEDVENVENVFGRMELAAEEAVH